MRLKASAALLHAAALAALTHASGTVPVPLPRERILPDLVRRADATWAKLERPAPAYGCRELFTAMLAYAEARTNLTRTARLLTLAEGLQDRDPASRTCGNFRWYSRDAEVLDLNAADFCMQHGALLWRDHRDRLDPDTRERLRNLLTLGLRAILNHRPRTTYTNIALLNASDLVLLGEALGDAPAAAEGERRLALFAKTLWEEGLHEFVSPTYYGVNADALALLESLAGKPETRDLARVLLDYLWLDLALNWFAPAQRLGGPHSRTYDYVFGFGELDQPLAAHGWLPLPPKFTFTAFAPLYARWQPPADLWRLCTSRFPRLVEQSWGAHPLCRRTYYACPDIALGVSWRAYPGRMDIPLAADFPSPRDARLPRLSFIPDGRADPYGRKPVFDGKTHSKAFHLSPFWAAVQDRSDALGVAVYRDSDFKDATGTLESHLLLPKRLDALWLGDAPLALADAPPSSRPVPPGTPLFLRHGTAALALRVPWTLGQDNAPCRVVLVDDGNPYGVVRLTVTHTLTDTNRHPARAHAGAAFWLRAGSGLADETAFAAFRAAFTAAPSQAHADAAGLRVTVSGLARPLTVAARAPYRDDPEVSPAPPQTVLGLDGQDVGRAALERSPVLRAYLASRRREAVIEVAADAPTEWEAEAAAYTVPYETAPDPLASGGAFLWVPDGDAAGGGSATCTLRLTQPGRFLLSGRILTPTPEDDSFFLSVTTPDGRAALPETAWSPGVYKTWSWRDVAVSGTRAPTPLDLPAGRSTLTVRPREPGSRLDRLRLTPLPR